MNDLKKLKSLLRVLRENGVLVYEAEGVKLSLSPEAMKLKKKIIEESALSDEPSNPYKDFPKDILTPEQLMYYSAGGRPEEDPENADV